jgi:hypothetical protein
MDASDWTGTWKRTAQRFRWSEAGLWAWLDLDQRPHPYQRWTAERHANRRSRRSFGSVSATGMGSISGSRSGLQCWPVYDDSSELHWRGLSEAANEARPLPWAVRVGVVTARQPCQLDLRMGLLKVVRRCSLGPASPRVEHPIGLTHLQLRPDRRAASWPMAAGKVGEQCAAGKAMGLPVGAAAPSGV